MYFNKLQKTHNESSFKEFSDRVRTPGDQLCSNVYYNFWRKIDKLLKPFINIVFFTGF